MKNLIAHLLSTGDEILSGALVDTNNAHITNFLLERGIKTTKHISLGDNLQELVLAFRESAEKADIVIVTGGLGPTMDDLSSLAAARAAKKELVLDKEALLYIKELFKMFNTPMPESNEKQAWFPEGATRLDNEIGTAPGFYMKIKQCTFFFLPGPPREMKLMLEKGVGPVLDKLSGNSALSGVRVISTFGKTEADIARRVEDISLEGVSLGIRAAFPVIFIRLYAVADNEKILNERLDSAVHEVLSRVKDQVFSIKGLSMEETLAELLLLKGKTLSCGESCTGGLISHLLTEVPGSSGFFHFSGVTYSNEAKVAVLKVKPETIKKFGAVSLETVREMAKGARKAGASDFGIATSGIAGPGGGTAEKPVGLVCMAIESEEISFSKEFVFPFDRARNKVVFATTAMDMLRRILLDLPLPDYGIRKRRNNQDH